MSYIPKSALQRGQSAYELALEQGFIGTLPEWLASLRVHGIQGLKGDKGDKGDKGEKGEKGDKGEPGENGNGNPNPNQPASNK
jgi:hypothetical protein